MSRAGSDEQSFQDTINRASKTTARMRSSRKAAKITVSRMAIGWAPQFS